MSWVVQHDHVDIRDATNFEGFQILLQKGLELNDPVNSLVQGLGSSAASMACSFMGKSYAFFRANSYQAVGRLS